ncbi:MAG: hypothetical protein K2V38_10240, partial [Gemmataceae bacterium]|nr:hypothetical protein [Gemmataceae bacterium]
MSATLRPRSAPLSVGRFPLVGRADVGLPDVYRARDPDTDGLVAVYLFPGADRPAATLESLAGLDHPNVVRVLDHGREGG